MKVNQTMAATALILTIALLCGCPGTMLVEAIDAGDDDSQSGDDDDLTPDDDDDLTPGDDDDLTPGDDDTEPGDDDDTAPGDDDDTAPGDDDDTAPGPTPVAECGAFRIPQGNFANGSVHYSGKARAERADEDDPRIWNGCEVRRYFDSDDQYECQIYWSLTGPREDFGPSDGPNQHVCSVYMLEATYIGAYSDCSPSDLGNEANLLDNFVWIYGTEYQFNLSTLSLYVGNSADPEIPYGPSGGPCGFNGPQGNEWFLVESDVGYQNMNSDGSPGGWDYVDFQYSTDFQPRN